MQQESVNTNRIRFLNTYIDNLTAAEAKDCLDRFIRAGGTHYIVSPNSDIVVKMQDDPELKRVCENADMILTDGQILVKISRRFGIPIKERVCMTDFVWDVFDLALEKGYKVFLFGGKEDVLARATQNIKRKLPTLNIVDSYSPPFGFEQSTELLKEANDRVRKSGADILIVFLGCPKQEKFIAQNKDLYNIPMSITMGGCVDFIAGDVRRAPLWMQRAGLEWLYRFMQEPGRLFRRYFIEDVKIFSLAYKYRHKR